MKKLFSFVVASVLLTASIGSALAYSLSQKDEKMIENAVEKISAKIDAAGESSRAKYILTLKKLQRKYANNQRMKAILSQVTKQVQTSLDLSGAVSDPIVGNDRDEHGCIGSAGYSWSGTLSECIRPWETQETSSGTATQTTSTGGLLGGDRDEHGCIGSAGYSWSGSTNKCARPWEGRSPAPDAK